MDSILNIDTTTPAPTAAPAIPPTTPAPTTTGNVHPVNLYRKHQLIWYYTLTAF